MACTAKQLVCQIKKWIGFTENNGRHKQIIDIYNSYKPHPAGYKMSYSDSWCAATVSAAAIALNATDIIPVECSCGRYVDKAKKMGVWVENDAHKPSVGDIVLYDWDDNGKGDDKGWPDHIGVVVSVSGSKFTVIEGNKNDGVGYRTMSVNGRYIRGFVCPKYSKEAAKKTTASKPYDSEIDNLARRVINGEFGNGEARKKALGSKYAAVQKRVNEILC